MDAEKINVFELMQLYGPAATDFAKPFLRGEYIKSPIYYRAFADLFLWHIATQTSRDEYEKLLSIYNADVTKRFKGTIEAIKNVSLRLDILHAFSGWTNFFINNYYDKSYKTLDNGRLLLKDESDLEHIIYDSLEFFDPYRVSVKKQHFLNPGGAIDLVVSYEEHTFLIELKKSKSRRKDVYQILDYSKRYGDLGKVSTILIASDFDEGTAQLAKENGVSCYEYTCGTVMPDCYIHLERNKESSENPAFDALYDELLDCDGILARLPKFEENFQDKWKTVNKLIDTSFNNIKMA